MNKRVLITGAAGFVGSHVVQYFLENTSFDVVCLVRLNKKGDLKNLKDHVDNPRCFFVYHDLKFDLNESVRDYIGHVDYILHLAANSHVDRSILHPKEFFEDNLTGTVNILEFLRLHMPEARFINFSTDEVYGAAPEGYKYKEEDRFRPSNPYSASKACQSMASFSYFNTYSLDIINTYTMNIFGPNQNSEKLIPKAIKYAIERKPMPVFAELSGNTLLSVGSRHWLDVRNVGESLLFLLENGVKGESYNIVGTDEFTNEEIVLKINLLLNTEPMIEYVDLHKTRPGHDRRYAIDGAKLSKLGWEPKITFEEGIKNIIDILRAKK
ncbi:MAG: GDP-mannose 4,6-dehydratase [Patescibacteria group bacterium]